MTSFADRFPTAIANSILIDFDGPGSGPVSQFGPIGADIDALATAIAPIDKGPATVLAERFLGPCIAGRVNGFTVGITGIWGLGLDALTARVAALDGGQSSYSFTDRLYNASFDLSNYGLWEAIGADMDTLAARIASLNPVSIGTPISLGGAENVTSVTTGADCPVGSLIVVLVADYESLASDFSGATVSDSAGNIYDFVAQSTPTTGIPTTTIFACINSASDLPNGGTISCSASRGEQIHAACVSGANGGKDQTNSVVNSVAGTSLTVAVPTLAQASEIVFGAADNGENMIGVTETGGYTRLQDTAVRKWIDFAYLKAASTTPASYGPSTFTSATNSGVVAAFKASAR